VQSARTFDTSSEYALKQIRHNCIDVGTLIIKRVCKEYVSERMSDCPGVGGRKYDVESRVPESDPIGSGGVRFGPIGSDGVISHTATHRPYGPCGDSCHRSDKLPFVNLKYAIA